MTQSWHDLLFAHWPVEPSRVRALVPAAFDLDLYDGDAWVGVVPFQMTNVGVRGLPALPWLSSFPELNVRTYVRVGDKPGVYFFSLDAGRRPAVWAARALLNLPYFSAAMAVQTVQDRVVYRSERRGAGPAALEAEYAPASSPFPAPDGSFEAFLTERYCLYHVTRSGAPYRLEIHHPRWTLQAARAEIDVNTMMIAAGLEVDGPPALVHFARRQDVIAWAPALLRATAHLDASVA